MELANVDITTTPGLAVGGGGAFFFRSQSTRVNFTLTSPKGLAFSLSEERPSLSLTLCNLDDAALPVHVFWRAELTCPHGKIFLSPKQQGTLGGGGEKTSLLLLEISTEHRNALVTCGKIELKPGRLSIKLERRNNDSSNKTAAMVNGFELQVGLRFQQPNASRPKSTARLLYELESERDALLVQSRVSARASRFNFDDFSARYDTMHELGSKACMDDRTGYCVVCDVVADLRFGAKSQRLHRNGRAHQAAYREYVQAWHEQFRARFAHELCKVRDAVMVHWRGLARAFLHMHTNWLARSKEFAAAMTRFVLQTTYRLGDELFAMFRVGSFAPEYLRKLSVEETSQRLWLREVSSNQFPWLIYYDMLCEHFVGPRSTTVWQLVSRFVQ